MNNNDFILAQVIWISRTFKNHKQIDMYTDRSKNWNTDPNICLQRVSAARVLSEFVFSNYKCHNVDNPTCVDKQVYQHLISTS